MKALLLTLALGLTAQGSAPGQSDYEAAVQYITEYADEGPLSIETIDDICEGFGLEIFEAADENVDLACEIIIRTHDNQ